jgi:hypothetical protein
MQDYGYGSQTLASATSRRYLMLLSVAAPKHVRAEISVRRGLLSMLHFTNPTPATRNSGGGMKPSRFMVRKASTSGIYTRNPTKGSTVWMVLECCLGIGIIRNSRLGELTYSGRGLSLHLSKSVPAEFCRKISIWSHRIASSRPPNTA